MNKNKTQEFIAMDIPALKEAVDNLRLELFTLRLRMRTAHIKDYSQFKKLRKDIARALTIVHQKNV